MSKDMTCSSDFEWAGGKDGIINFSDKMQLPVSVPPVFGGDKEKVNPEELLSASLNACTSITLLGTLKRTGAPMEDVQSFTANTEGRYGKGKSGLEFKEFVINARFTVKPGGDADTLRKKVESTEVHCLVEKHLQIPVTLNSEVIIASEGK
jgi:organic hydroperoxide reductase OsmC/OhrA